MPQTSLPHAHHGGLAAVLERMPDGPAFAQAAELFAQMSDPSRLRILWILCHSEECVTNIAAAVGMCVPGVSHHLRILRKAGLAVGTRCGQEVHYRLSSAETALLVHRMVDEVFMMNCPGTGIP